MQPCHITQQFLSTPSARRATSYALSVRCTRSYFYPRPPRGGRRAYQGRHHKGITISIHALREEGDFEQRKSGMKYQKFLSTPSARRATQDFTKAPQTLAISIHALREEGDHCDRRFRYKSTTFLSTPSARRATSFGANWTFYELISIHALREEGDHFEPRHTA